MTFRALVLLGAVSLAVPGCDWLEPQPARPQDVPAPAGPLHPVPRAASEIAVPETYQQLDLLFDLQERVLELEIEIAERNEYYATSGFIDFLDLDPYGLPADQVYFLKHFCDSGDFTLPREAQVLLLERELVRRREEGLPFYYAGIEAHSSLLGRLDDTFLRYEQRIADLEKIAALYRTTSGEVMIDYPENISPEQLDAERRYVVRRQFEIGEEMDALDESIDALRASLEAFE